LHAGYVLHRDTQTLRAAVRANGEIFSDSPPSISSFEIEIPFRYEATRPRCLAGGTTRKLVFGFKSANLARSSPLNWSNMGGNTMRLWTALGMLLASTVAAYAQAVPAVPEIDALSGVAAMSVVGSIAALIWERRRKK
jgi:hypothetical protein